MDRALAMLDRPVTDTIVTVHHAATGTMSVLHRCFNRSPTAAASSSIIAVG